MFPKLSVDLGPRSKGIESIPRTPPYGGRALKFVEVAAEQSTWRKPVREPKPSGQQSCGSISIACNTISPCGRVFWGRLRFQVENQFTDTIQGVSRPRLHGLPFQSGSSVIESFLPRQPVFKGRDLSRHQEDRNAVSSSDGGNISPAFHVSIALTLL